MIARKFFRSSKFRYSVIFLLIVITPFSYSYSLRSHAQQDLEFTLAPFSDDFLKYIENREAGQAIRMYTDEGYPLGAIPDPIDVKSLIKSTAPILIGQLPPKYDLRTINKLTPVRNQGSCGACWAFAALGSLESSHMPKDKEDFSEQHLIDNHGFAFAPCEGGNLRMAVAYLIRWAGPLNESDKPYLFSTFMETIEERRHVQNVVFVPPRSDSLDNTEIKQAVIKYGAVSVSMRWDSIRYNPANHAFFNPSDVGSVHFVSIVGWDDSYSKLNFLSIPDGDGAFIARNSWGSAWGEGGYFYVSYHDPYFASDTFNTAFKKAEGVGNFKEKYEYDPNGWIQSLAVSSSETGWMANIFKARSNTPLKAVSFYAIGSPTYYTIYVYTGVIGRDPESGILAKKKGGRIEEPGYYSIPFNRVPLTVGEKFSVVVKINTVGNHWPIPIEIPIKGYTKKVKAGPGQSFISSDGEWWIDMSEDFENANVCLKAFTKQ